MNGTTSIGIILAQRDFSEADRIVVLFSKDYGKISLLAKGVRKLTSRKRGHLEVFNLIKYQTITGRGLNLIIEAEVVKDFKGIRNSLKKISVAYYFVEVIGRIVHDEEPNIEIFKLLEKYLNLLEVKKELKELRLNFILEILVLMGFWPQGTKLINPEAKLEEVIERRINSQRVGKKITLT